MDNTSETVGGFRARQALAACSVACLSVLLHLSDSHRRISHTDRSTEVDRLTEIILSMDDDDTAGQEAS